MTGIEVTTIACPGSTPAHADALSGRVSAMFGSALPPHIETGRVRALGRAGAAAGNPPGLNGSAPHSGFPSAPGRANLPPALAHQGPP